MKRIITIILVIAMVLTAMFSLAACSKTGECEYCGQNEALVKYTYSNGDSVNGMLSSRTQPVRWFFSFAGGLTFRF